MPTNLNLGIVASGLFGIAPANTVAPTISGTAQDRQVLTVNLGTWTGEPLTYSYQWQYGSSAYALWYNRSGATGQTYTLTSSDVGWDMRCIVTASNHLGSATVNTAATATVTGVIVANGGVVPEGTLSGGYRYHRFNASGTFTITANSLNRTIEYQIMGGGQGGRNFLTDKSSIPTAGGGGGGGDFQSGNLGALGAGNYTVTVGGGGSAGGNAGTSSSFHTSGSFGTGGGRGGDSSGDRIGYAGTGGSGNGADGNRTSNTQYAAGGGGGSTGSGTAGTASTGVGGSGGSGTAMWTNTSGTVTSTTHGGGGGGGGYNTGGSGGIGGATGGGSGGSGFSASANRGGGGGGAGRSGSGGSGGSGTVIIRYLA